MELPFPVKVLSIVAYIKAFASLVAGITFFMGSTTLSNLVPYVAILGSFTGLFFILFAIITAIVGFGLMKKHNWARAITIISLITGTIIAITSLFAAFFPGLFFVFIYSGIAYYLWFNQEVIDAFEA